MFMVRLLIAAALAGGAPAMAQAQPPVNGVMVTYRDAVRVEPVRGLEVRTAVPVPPGLMEARRQRLAMALGLPADQVVLARQLSTGAHLFRFKPSIRPETLMSLLSAHDADVVAISPDRRSTVQVAMPGQVRREPYFTLQWQLKAIGLPKALAQADGTGVVVAVLDTGTTPHPELDGQWLPGWDFVSAPDSNDGDGWDADPSDVPQRAGEAIDRTPWHGTKVGALLAAKLDGSGLVGVAPGARLLPVRVVDGTSAGDADIVDAIHWATGGVIAGVPANPTPARVVNLSLGETTSCAPDYQAAIDAARARGAVIVAAAGNDGAEASGHSPSNCAGVISVGSSTRGGKLAQTSNRNADLVAPAGDGNRPGHSNVLTASNHGIRQARGAGYEFVSGTSMAAPQVAGVVALMLEVRPNATSEQIKRALLASATRLPRCVGCGAGLLNAPGALDKIRELVDTGTIASP